MCHVAAGPGGYAGFPDPGTFHGQYTPGELPRPRDLDPESPRFGIHHIGRPLHGAVRDHDAANCDCHSYEHG